MNFSFRNLVSPILLGLAVLALPVDIARALEIRHTLLDNAELVQLELSRGGSECLVQRTGKNTLQLELPPGEILSKSQAKNIVKSGLIQAVECGTHTILIRLKSAEFGFVATQKNSNRHLSLYLFRDRYGSHWDSESHTNKVTPKKTPPAKSVTVKTKPSVPVKKAAPVKMASASVQQKRTEKKVEVCDNSNKAPASAVESSVKEPASKPAKPEVMPEAMRRSWHFAPNQNRSDGLYDLRPRVAELPQPGF